MSDFVSQPLSVGQTAGEVDTAIRCQATPSATLTAASGGIDIDHPGVDLDNDARSLLIGDPSPDCPKKLAATDEGHFPDRQKVERIRRSA